MLYLRQWSVADEDPSRAHRRTEAPGPSPVVAALAGLVGAAFAPPPTALVTPARHRRAAGADSDVSPA